MHVTTMQKIGLTTLVLGLTAVAASLSIETFHADGSSSTIEYLPPTKAKKPWKIGVVFPTLQDPYWVAANYGLMQEAKRLGVQVKLMTASGYSDVSGQNNLIDSFLDEDIQALIVSPLNSKLQEAKLSEFARKKKIPLVSLMDAGDSKVVATRIQAPREAAAYELAEFLGKQTKGRGARVAFLPGPAGSGWAEQLYKGFEAAGKQQGLQLVSTKWGDTNRHIQSQHIESILNEKPDIDMIVGNAVAIQVATEILAKRRLQKDIQLVSLSSTTEIAKAIQSKTVLAAANDYNVLLARLSIWAAVDLIEGKKIPPMLSTRPNVLSLANMKTFSSSAVPNGYRPVFFMNWK